jgi:hypothetical protein
VTLGTVIDAYDRLVQTIERSEFASVLNVLMSGDEAEANEVRALQLLADRGGDNVTSRSLTTRYGFSSHSRVPTSLARLQGRGLVDQRDRSWYIVDPLFAEWLRRASPLADHPGPGAAPRGLELCTGLVVQDWTEYAVRVGRSDHVALSSVRSVSFVVTRLVHWAWRWRSSRLSRSARPSGR